MRHFAIGLFSASILAVSATSAFAKKSSIAVAPAPKVKSYKFEEDVIRGTIASPDQENLAVRTFDPQSSLIRLRTGFVREIVKSAEDL